MKKFNKLFAVVFISFFAMSQVEAQIDIIIPTANNAGTGSGASPHRKPLGSNRSYERSAMKYTHQEIDMVGNITAVGFYCDSLLIPGITPVKVFIKEVIDSSFTASTVAAEEASATLVYNDTLYPKDFALDKFTNLILTTPFLHKANKNIEVIVETNSGGINGSDTTTVAKGFRYFAVGTNRFQYWQSAAGNGTIPNANGTLNNNRPNIKLTIVPEAPCNAPPTAGLTVSSKTKACIGSPILFSLSGSSDGSGLTYQWISSLDSINWSVINGAIQSTLTDTINSKTYIRCIVTCSGLSDTSSPISITLNSFYNCYCTQNIGGGCVTSAIDSVAIEGSSLMNGSSGCSINNYIAYPASGKTTATLNQGQIYTLTTRFTGNVRAGVWIDYNQNGSFDPSEYQQICSTSPINSDVTMSLIVPINALTGKTGMRIRSRTNSGTMDSTNACSLFNNGETEDYTITIFPFVPCNAPPNAGTTLASTQNGCMGTIINLSLTGSTTGSGLSYQWIYSIDAGTNWNAINGAIYPIYADTLRKAIIYRCVLTCGGLSDTSSPAIISLNTFYNCYCTQGIGGGCATSAIDSVAIAGSSLMNGSTGCSLNNYIAYPASGKTTATVNQGQIYTLTNRFTGNVRAGVWIDYNQNGSFDPAEYQQICTTSATNSDVNISLLILPTALTGQTGMRIRSRATAGTMDSTNACTTFGSGETEDYIITIAPSTNCTSPPVAGKALSSLSTACPETPVLLSLTGNSIGSGMTFQWLSSKDGGLSWNPILGATKPIYNDTIHTLISYKCVLICSGLSDTSSAAVIAVNNYFDCYCTQGIGGGCATSAIDSVSIIGTTLSNGPTGCSLNNYIAYPASGKTTASIIQGQTYTMTNRFTGNVRAGVWIDYNHNGIFDPVEYQLICNTSTINSDISSSLSIPFDAMTGPTGMRIRSRATANTLNASNACTNFNNGETEDYLIIISQAALCTSPPLAGNTLSSITTSCPGSPVHLSLTGNSTGSGMTFQWLSSTDGGTSWNPIMGATKPTYDDTIRNAIIYKCVLTCSGLSDTSSSAVITLNSFYNCYCSQSIGGGCATSAIDSVSIIGTTLTNGPTGCSTNNYVTYAAFGNTTATLIQGQSYTMSNRFAGNVRAGVWIDYNQNGIFDPLEYQQICTTSTINSEISISMSIPLNALIGLTGMRIRSRSIQGTMDSTNACSTFGSGETEDYIITIAKTLEIKEQTQIGELNIFPNPSNGELTLKNSYSGLRNGKVYNILGELVYKFTMQPKQLESKLELSNQSKGVYFIQLSDNKKSTAIKKLIIQ